MSFTAERLKNFGQGIKENIWPTSEKEAGKRIWTAFLLGLGGCAIGFAAAVGKQRLGPEFERIYTSSLVVGIGGLVDGMWMSFHQRHLEEKDFVRRFAEKTKQLKDSVNNLPLAEFETRLKALRELQGTIKKFDKPRDKTVDNIDKISKMVMDVYEERARSEGIIENPQK